MLAVVADVRRLAIEPTLRALVRSESFEVTLVTTTPEKAERLRAALADSAVTPIPVRVAAVPRLLSLVGQARPPPRA